MVHKAIDLAGLPPFTLSLPDIYDRYVTQDILRDGVWEAQHTELVRRFIAPGDSFIDVGANVGWYTMIAALTVGPTGRVFAFEPDPNHTRLIRRSLADASIENVTLVEAGASDESTRTDLYLCDENLGDHRLAPLPGRKSIEVAAVRIDDIVPPNQKIRMMKVDTQGWEPKVIAGASATIARERPDIMIEYWPHGLANSGLDWAPAFSFLESLSYKAFDIGWTDGALTPMSRLDLETYAAESVGGLEMRFLDLFLSQTDPRT